MSATYQRRHFEMVAATIKAEVDAYNYSETQGYLDPGDTAIASINNIAQGFMRVFSADNPRFDAERFLSACGLE